MIRRGLLLAGALACGACGGAAKPSKTAEPSGGSPALQEAPIGAPEPALVAPDGATAQRQLDDAAKAFEAADGCVSLCKALGSMQRAADRICDLAKDGGAPEQQRCTDARAKVEGASAKVKASCGGCG